MDTRTLVALLKYWIEQLSISGSNTKEQVQEEMKKIIKELGE